MQHRNFSRRAFIRQSALSGASLTAFGGVLSVSRAPAAVASEAARPQVTWGLQLGDVLADRATLWSRSDRPAKLDVEWSLDERFRHRHRVRAVPALADSDFTARVELAGLPADAQVFVRATFEALDGGCVRSEPLTARFRSAPQRGRNVRFVWGGDTAGQGWGINPDFGGMKIYESMRRAEPDFFIHSGDNIYADGPMTPEVRNAAGELVWRNAFLDVVPEKLKVAETLHEYRRAYLYNRYDSNLRAFSAEVPQIWQWDDHEVINNWSPSKTLDARYTTQDVNVLLRNASQAFREYSPMPARRGDELGRIYRHLPYGEDLDVFVLDMRSYRAGNGCNVEPEPSPGTAYLGRPQLEWLKRKLRSSSATWKVIASDMPLGLIVGDGSDPASGCARFENSANGDGPVLGREFEIAELLRFIKRSGIRNVVWLTADVHYAAAHYYDPAAATFQDFEPFWEFVSGPLNAGTFGPNALDDTFGPSVIFQKAPAAGQANLAPSAGMQFFGQVDIDHLSKKMLVSLKDIDGKVIFSQELTPGSCW